MAANPPRHVARTRQSEVPGSDVLTRRDETAAILRCLNAALGESEFVTALVLLVSGAPERPRDTGERDIPILDVIPDEDGCP